MPNDPVQVTLPDPSTQMLRATVNPTLSTGERLADHLTRHNTPFPSIAWACEDLAVAVAPENGGVECTLRGFTADTRFTATVPSVAGISGLTQACEVRVSAAEVPALVTVGLAVSVVPLQ